MPSLADTYYERASGMLARARETNGPVVARLAPLIGQSIARGGVVHTFGSGHSELISREIIGRAGGLVCVTGIIDPTGGFTQLYQIAGAITKGATSITSTLTPVIPDSVKESE